MLAKEQSVTFKMIYCAVGDIWCEWRWIFKFPNVNLIVPIAFTVSNHPFHQFLCEMNKWWLCFSAIPSSIHLWKILPDVYLFFFSNIFFGIIIKDRLLVQRVNDSIIYCFKKYSFGFIDTTTFLNSAPRQPINMFGESTFCFVYQNIL